MYSSIVVGTDGSETAAEAVRRAVKLAKVSGANLHIVGAIKVPAQALAAGEFGVVVAGAGMPEFEADARALMEGILGRSEADAAAAGVTVATHFVLGEAAEALMDVAASTEAELIVVGNRGMKGMGRVLGSVPNKISHHCPCDLLIVHTT